MSAKKRANGEGSIRKRYEGCWEGRYTAGYDILTGKRIQKGVFAKTKKECAANVLGRAFLHHAQGGSSVAEGARKHLKGEGEGHRVSYCSGLSNFLQ